MSEDRLPERVLENEKHANGAAHNDSIVQSASLFLLARRILMTSLGAIALTFEETNEFIERLIERGEVAEQEINALVDDVSARAKGTITRLPELPLLPRLDDGSGNKPDMLHPPEAQNGVAAPLAKPGPLGERVESILGRLNVPSRGDIDTLTRKIDLLSGKVQLLKGRGPRVESQGPGGESQELDVSAETQETA